eukprot:scaffold2956_cov390-Prasinococcus_capsulatus_cf.AAC.12
MDEKEHRVATTPRTSQEPRSARSGRRTRSRAPTLPEVGQLKTALVRCSAEAEAAGPRAPRVPPNLARSIHRPRRRSARRNPLEIAAGRGATPRARGVAAARGAGLQRCGASSSLEARQGRGPPGTAHAGPSAGESWLGAL